MNVFCSTSRQLAGTSWIKDVIADIVVTCPDVLEDKMEDCQHQNVRNWGLLGHGAATTSDSAFCNLIVLMYWWKAKRHVGIHCFCYLVVKIS